MGFKTSRLPSGRRHERVPEGQREERFRRNAANPIATDNHAAAFGADVSPAYVNVHPRGPGCTVRSAKTASPSNSRQSPDTIKLAQCDK